MIHIPNGPWYTWPGFVTFRYGMPRAYLWQVIDRETTFEYRTRLDNGTYAPSFVIAQEEAQRLKFNQLIVRLHDHLEAEGITT